MRDFFGAMAAVVDDPEERERALFQYNLFADAVK